MKNVKYFIIGFSIALSICCVMTYLSIIAFPDGKPKIISITEIACGALLAYAMPELIKMIFDKEVK